MKTAVRRRDVGAWLNALPEAIALTLVAALPAFLNLASERIFEEEESLLLRAGALLALPGVMFAWRTGKVRLWRQPAVVALCAFVAVLAIAAAMGIAPREAFLGAYVRRHGVITWTALVVIFAAMCLAGRTAAGRDRLLTAATLGSIWPSIYAIVQRAGMDPISWVGANPDRSASTLGNPILLGGYLAVVIPLTALQARRSRPAIAALVLQLTALALSGSRGPLLGLLVGALVFAAIAGANSVSKRTALAIALALLLAAAGAVAIRRLPSEDTREGSTRVRVLVWQGVTQLMRSSGRHLWLGYGPESLARVFPPYYSAEIDRLERGAMPDRAHNETLDTLVGAGLVGVVAEWLFFGAALWSIAGIGERRTAAAFGAAAVGHLVEIHLGIASVASRLLFLSVVAMSVGMRGEAAPARATFPERRRDWLWLAAPALAGALSPLVSALPAVNALAPASPAREILDYVGGLSEATPLLYIILLAAAALVGWTIARGVERHASAVVHSGCVIAALLVAIPLAVTPSRADVFSNVGALSEHQQQWRHAAVVYGEASRMAPRESYYLTGLGRALSQQAMTLDGSSRREQLALAREAFERAYALDPSNPDHARHLAGFFRLQAWASRDDSRDGSLAEADRRFAEAVRLAPGIAGAWIEWAYVDAERGQPQRALDKLEHAQTLDDRRVELWLARGYVHEMQHRAADALQDYDRALSGDAGRIDALRGRAVALAQLHRPADAVATLDALLALTPGDTELRRMRTELAAMR